MHCQVVNFQLDGVSDAQFREMCDQLAPTWAAIPGMVSKVWLANAEENRYGGVYLWRDRAAMDDFVRGDLFRMVASHPNLKGVTAADYGIMDGPTALTHGIPAVAATA
jgi:hypothetical protein